MINLDKRKKQLREYIEARKKFREENVTSEAWMQDRYYPSDEVNYLDFCAKAVNESSKIAEQLLECIEALEAINLPTKNGNSTEIERSMSALAEKILNKIAGKK